jgi:hypothetical protein
MKSLDFRIQNQDPPLLLHPNPPTMYISSEINQQAMGDNGLKK